MAQAMKSNDAWHVLVPGEAVHHGEIVASYETVQTWTKEGREGFGVFEVADGEPVPAGQRIVSSAIGEKDGRPVWVNVFGPELPAPVPTEIGPLQFRRAVRTVGMKTVFDAFVEQLGEEDRETIEYATSIRRDDPLIEKARIELDWTGDQVDGLFRLGGTL